MSAQRPDPVPTERLHGVRVLVMEDEFLVALALETALEDFGCHVVGPFASVEEGLAGVEAEAIDVAILDVNLRDGVVLPVAQVLTDRGVPIMLHTSHSDPASLASPLNSFARVVKPCSDAWLKRELQALLGLRGPSPADA